MSTLLVIEPKVKLSAKVLQQLEAADFIVVRGMPSEFHIIGNHPSVSDPLVAKAALDAIGSYTNTLDNGNAMRSRFARALVHELGYGDAVVMK